MILKANPKYKFLNPEQFQNPNIKTPNFLSLYFEHLCLFRIWYFGFGIWGIVG
jgi:hypothetical protein